MIKKFNKFLSSNKLNRLRNYLTSNCIKLLINLIFLTVFLLGLIPIFLDFEGWFYTLGGIFLFLFFFIGNIFLEDFLEEFIPSEFPDLSAFRVFLAMLLVIIYMVKSILVISQEEQIKLLEKEKESKEILEFIGLNKEEATDCKKRLLTQDKKKIRDCIKILKDDNYF